MYDALLSGAAGATPSEQGLLRGVRAQVVGWRLRKRFAAEESAEAYRKATAFEALVSRIVGALLCVGVWPLCRGNAGAE